MNNSADIYLYNPTIPSGTINSADIVLVTPTIIIVD